MLETPLLERDLVELGRRDLPRVGPLPADAHGLLIASEILAGEPEPLGGHQRMHEPRAHLEAQAALEVGALRARRGHAAMGRSDALPTLSPQDELLPDAHLLVHRVAGADARRVRPPDREVAGSERQGGIRIEPGGRDVAPGGAHLERPGQQLRTLSPEQDDRLVERHLRGLLSRLGGPDDQSDGQREHEREPLHGGAGACTR